MSPLALALVLAAALCHATWNLIAKRSGGGGNEFVLLSATWVGIVWAPAAVWAGLRGVSGWGAWEWGVLVASALLHVLYFRCLLHGCTATIIFPGDDD